MTAAASINIEIENDGEHDPVALLDRAFRAAIVQAYGEQFAEVDPQVKLSANPQFGDFQVNGAMSLAKQLEAKPKPQDVARTLAGLASPGIDHAFEVLTIAGPGFINLGLRPEFLHQLLDAMDNPGLGVTPDADPHAIVIDMCGVNVAKQMHVGHLRSTIIGDCLARVFTRLGRKVFRENHLGDWGLPIAMVLHELRAQGVDLDGLEITQLDAAYRDAQLSAKGDVRGLAKAIEFGSGPHRIIELEEQNASADAALEAAKATLVDLQGGKAETYRDWRKLIDCTMRSFDECLILLSVDLKLLNNHGESFYRQELPGVIEAFKGAGLAQEDEGALIVRFSDRERPLLIRKRDGGYLYATTDLAAVRYRVQTLGASRVIYVVDARQRDHFKDVFDAARQIGWDRTTDGTPAQISHLGFGAVLGDDKKPLKTRSGENVTLKSLLQEAIDRGIEEVKRRAADPAAPTHSLAAAELASIGRAVGIGAVKYADLANDVVRDYVFDFDRMIAFEGDTGPYLQYAHARICSILAKAGLEPQSIRAAALRVQAPEEKRLALLLLRFGGRHGVLADVARMSQPHRLCAYLHELAESYSGFYQGCPVLKAGDEATRLSRLRLCDLVRRVLAQGLGLLGIDAPERM